MTARLFLSKTTTEPVLLFEDKKAKYYYVFIAETESLKILKGQRSIHKQKARIGDAFFCTVRDKEFMINQLHFPRKRSDLVAWTIGYPKELRAANPEHFSTMYEDNYRQNVKGKAPENWCLSDNKYYYVSMCKPKNYSITYVGDGHADMMGIFAAEPIRLAAYISEDITTQSICKLFSSYLETNTFDFPLSYFEKICLRLGLSKSEIARIVKNKESRFASECVVRDYHKHYIRKAYA
ncbi:MAG: hypothetical protein IKJ32_00200 [Clostridia bacterium]|nr:hypothetical protein [Clostridia bacterium]